MESTRWEQAQSLFHQALELPQPERQAFLDSACSGDAGLAAEVVAMLNADSGGSSLLDDGLSAIAQQFIAAAGQTTTVGEIGPYKLTRILGEGGMGVVWLAQREDTGAIVAIKLLLGAGFSPARRERFTREIKTLAKLRHQYIAHLYDAGALPDGTPWFVMEHIEGERLADYCRSRKLSIDERLRLFHKICEAVQYAHSQEIIHRDLKPSNILVEKDGTPKLLDFGIARELQANDDASEHTRPGLRFHSPYYSAPEWLRDGTVGFFTDVYSLGIILYEVLAGKLPVDRSRSAEENERGLAKAPPEKPSISALNNDTLGKNARKQAWPDLDLLCLKAMRWDAKERYQSVEALLRDLDHYLKNEPLEARPDSVRYRMGKFVARNRRAVIATAAVLALVAGMSIFFTVRLAKATNKALAEAARTKRIQQFTQSLFVSTGGSGLNPGPQVAGPATDLRVITLLDRGSQEVDLLSTDPETQGDLYENYANLYDRLGQFTKADKLLLLALDRKQAALGPGDPEVAAVLVDLGIAEADQNHFKEAEQDVRRGIDIEVRRLPPDDPAVIEAKSALGKVVTEAGDYPRAISILQPLVQRKPSNLEEEYTMSQSLFWLATAELSTGNVDGAEELCQRSIALDRKLFGTTHPQVAYDLWNLGLDKSALSEDSAAEVRYREALELLKNWYGVDHPDTATLMDNLAEILAEEGKSDEAEALASQALKTQEHYYSSDDQRLAETLDTLGKLKLKRGDLAGAEADLRRAYFADRSSLGDGNFQTATIGADLAVIYLQEERYAPAEPILRFAVTTLVATLPAGAGNTVFAQAFWGRTLLRLKRYSEAEKPLLAADDVLEKQPNQAPARLLQVRQDLAAVYEALNQPERANAYRAEVASATSRPVNAQ